MLPMKISAPASGPPPPVESGGAASRPGVAAPGAAKAREAQARAPAALTDDPSFYRRIARQVQGQIADGTYAVGTLLPTEAELCATHGASRYTIRAALKELIALGLIERRQGAGSRVVASAPANAYSHTMRTLAEFSQYARDTHFAIDEVMVVALDADAAALLRAPLGSRWVRVSGVRWSTDRSTVLGHTTVYVHLRFAPLLADVAQTTGAIYALVEQRSGEAIMEAVQEITARPIPSGPARALKVRAGSIAVCCLRRYLDASGGAMLTSVNWHLADRFSHVMTIRRGDWAP